MSFWQSEKTTMSHVVSPHETTTADSKPRARHFDSPWKYGLAKRVTRASVRKNRRRVGVVDSFRLRTPASSRDRVDASSAPPAPLSEGFADFASRRAAPRRARSVSPMARADMASRGAPQTGKSEEFGTTGCAKTVGARLISEVETTFGEKREHRPVTRHFAARANAQVRRGRVSRCHPP